MLNNPIVRQKNQSTLQFSIGRSRYRKLAMTWLHAFSILACWLNALPTFYQLGFSIMVVVSWCVQYKACEDASIFLRYTVTEGWAVRFGGEHYFPIRIKSTTVTGRMLTVLHFTIDERVETLVIFKDAMSANDYRRLVVNLKICEHSQG